MNTPFNKITYFNIYFLVNIKMKSFKMNSQMCQSKWADENLQGIHKHFKRTLLLLLK